MALEASSTSWTYPRSVHTHGAPFAGLSLSGTTPSSGAFAGAGEGVALVVLGLGAIALWYGLRESSRTYR